MSHLNVTLQDKDLKCHMVLDIYTPFVLLLERRKQTNFNF